MPNMPNKKYRINSVGKVHGKKTNWLKDQSHKSIYYSKRWINLRKSYMMNNPVCVQCTKPMKFLDHIIPISEGGAIWDLNNMQGLCVSCNASKTAKQNKKSCKVNKYK